MEKKRWKSTAAPVSTPTLQKRVAGAVPMVESLVLSVEAMSKSNDNYMIKHHETKTLTEIKPCPFCDEMEVNKYGNEPVLSHLGQYIHVDGSTCTLGYAVKCPHCGCSGPSAGQECDALEFWNERF